MRVALVYDRINKWGGAERVLLALHELFPEAPLYTAVYHSEKAPWAKVFPKVIPSFLNKIVPFQDKHEYLAPLMPIAFESFDFDGYDLVISVTSEAAKGIITKPSTLHICYCLTPTRYLWSMYDFYFKNSIFKVLTKPAISYLRKWDKIASQRPDAIIAISSSVHNKIKKYYGRESKVIYPPVDINKFQITNSKLQTNKEGYFLFVSRLIPYKRADIAIAAFNELGYPLMIVGIGSKMNKLQKMANKNIKFLGKVSDEELARLYDNAKALVFPGEEDFGIVMAEAQASGTPVIAYRAGGALDIIKDKETGLFFEKQGVEDLKKAIKFFAKLKFNNKELRKSAERFSKANFQKAFLELVDEVVD